MASSLGRATRAPLAGLSDHHATFRAPATQCSTSQTPCCARYLENKVGQTREWAGKQQFGRRTKKVAYRKRVCPPVCLMKGVSGGFWESSEEGASFSGQIPKSREKSNLLLNIISEIEPLDISELAQEASADSMDAMKRTISGILGLLPSDQFNVTVETEVDALRRLLVSSMMTGYTLRNADYRFSLHKSLAAVSEEEPRDTTGASLVSGQGENTKAATQVFATTEAPLPVAPLMEGLPPDAQEYIRYLESKLAEANQALEEANDAIAKLEQHGAASPGIASPAPEDDVNVLLEYLRSLSPEQVAPLSRASPDVEEAIGTVIDVILEDLSANQAGGGGPAFGSGVAPVAGVQPWAGGPGVPPMLPVQQFQTTLTASRDYIARLLFWCMLLGHHTRAVELRLDLNRTLSLNGQAGMGLALDEGISDLLEPNGGHSSEGSSG